MMDAAAVAARLEAGEPLPAGEIVLNETVLLTKPVQVVGAGPR